MRRLIPFLLAAIAGAAIALGVAAIADSGVEPVASIDADDLFEGCAFWSRLDHVQQVELVQLCRREISTQNTFGAAGPDPVDAYDVADLLAYVNAVLARAPDDVEGEQNAGGDAASVLDACAAAAERLRILGGPPRNDERSLLITNREWPRLAETASDPGWAGLHLRVAGQVARPEGSRPRAVVLKPGDSVAGPAVIGLTEVPDSIADGDYVEVSDGLPALTAVLRSTRESPRPVRSSWTSRGCASLSRAGRWH